MTSHPNASHLDRTDPANAGLNLQEQADREIDTYAENAREGLVLLAPEDRWDELLQMLGGQVAHGDLRYRGVTFRKGAVTAIIAQDGF